MNVTIYRVVPAPNERQHDGGIIAYCGKQPCDDGVVDSKESF
ncbi:MAG: hypothetical protein AAGA27_06845 [Pseudomonadota bacterium]